MNGLSDYAVWLVPMVVLILLSALFSGSEAALFSLTPRHRRGLKRGGVGARIADGLLADSERLLSAILFWNLLINMTYFAIVSIVAGRLERAHDGGAQVALVFTASSLLSIIFFSEMLPKSIAVLSPVRAAVLVAAPLRLAISLVNPLLPSVKTANVLASRLLWPTFQSENEIDLADIERAIELGTDDAALLERERAALRSLVEFAETRASELMRPRGKLMLVAQGCDPQLMLSESPPGGYVMVTDATSEKIVGSLGVRMLRPSQMDDIESFIEPVLYVPWAAPVSRVLERLNQLGISVAVVVDEYGEAIGALSFDRIVRKMLAPQHGQFEETQNQEAIEQLSSRQYRVSGSLPLRQLAKALGVALPDESVATVAGFIQRNNESLPRLGDQAVLDTYRLEVVEESDGGLVIEVTGRDEEESGKEGRAT